MNAVGRTTNNPISSIRTTFMQIPVMSSPFNNVEQCLGLVWRERAEGNNEVCKSIIVTYNGK